MSRTFAAACSSAERFLSAAPLVTASSSSSHICVDLASSKVEAALAALTKITKLGKKVRKATVHANTLVEHPGRFGRINFDAKHILYVFEVLANLPNLKSLVIELNFHVISFPVSAILAIFRKKQLKRLTLKRVHLGGCREDMEELGQLASSQAALTSFTMDCCRGIGATRALVYRLPNVQDLRVSSTALAPGADLVTPDLRVLKLDDVPDLYDEDCVALAQALCDRNNQVEDFYLVSSIVSEEATHAVTKALQNNSTLRNVTLHLDSEDAGYCMAEVVASNTTSLKSVDIRLHNDVESVARACGQMAHALRTNTNVKSLRLRMDIELESLPECVVEAFETTLRTNTTLQFLSLDDGIYRYPLSPDMKLQLALNECGGRALLRQDQTTGDDMVEALIRAAHKKDTAHSPNARHTSLDATFYLLSNVPELALQALEPSRVKKTIVQRTTSTGKVKKESSLGWKMPKSILMMRSKRTKLNIAPSA